VKLDVKLDKSIEALSNIQKGLINPVNRAMKVGAMELSDAIKKRINHESNGRKYKRRGVVHIASERGHPPNTDTGYLRRSVTWTRKQDWVFYVIVGARYASWLENGTTKMAARPFVRPERDRLKQRIIDRIVQAYKKATGNA
jgi:HK97 gp10 family phage protein